MSQQHPKDSLLHLSLSLSVCFHPRPVWYHLTEEKGGPQNHSGRAEGREGRLAKRRVLPDGILHTHVCSTACPVRGACTHVPLKAFLCWDTVTTRT